MERPALMETQFSDAELLTACGSGSRDAFESLYGRHQKRVYSVAFNYFGGSHDRAGDVTQQVFLKLFRQAVQFRGDSDFTTWLYRVTINACIDEHRKHRRFFGLTDFFDLAGPAFVQEDRIQRKEVSLEVQKVVGTLKPKFRAPVLLRYVEGLSYEEIAKILDCSVGTVSSRLNRGHKQLAKKLGHLRSQI